jgi:hypothetical protein
MVHRSQRLSSALTCFAQRVGFSVSASPSDVGQGFALPSVADEIWGFAPGSGIALSFWAKG